MPYQHFNMILCKGTSPEFTQLGLSVSIRVHHLLSVIFLIIALAKSFVKRPRKLTERQKWGIIGDIVQSGGNYERLQKNIYLLV